MENDFIKTAPVAETTNKMQAPFPILGIGTSAGGLKAVLAFLDGLPLDRPTDMAFVLVQRLEVEIGVTRTIQHGHCSRD